MLELNKVTYQPQTGKDIVLNEINMKIEENEIILICGESGSGKTTLVEIISGLIKAQRGIISWKSKSLSERERRWLCGVIFQFPERYFIGSTIGKELKIGHKSIREQNINNVLEKVGLGQINLKTPPEKLSGGQQRRLAVAVQLLRNPNIILMDEPTAGLDWSMKSDVSKLVRDLSGKNTIIIVTHEPNIFKKYASRIFYLDKGELNLSRR